MNELQIRITAEVQQFQAAMAKVETRLQSAEGILKKAQNSAEKYRGAMATLAGQLKRGEVSQDEYNKGITELSNGLLKQQDIINNSTREVNRLSKSYKELNTRSLVQSQTQLANSTQNLTNKVANGNGVAIEFNRIIQDAPFGIIGVGNNIQQLAGNFSNLSKTAGGTGPAIKAALSSLVSPANLALLAISALTAGWTAYNMGAFDAIFANKESKKSLDDLAEGIKSATANASVELTKINQLRNVIEDETLSREKRLIAIDKLQARYPQIFGNADREKLLNGELATSYDLLTKSIIARSKASIAEGELPELVKRKEIIDQELATKKQLLQEELDLLDTRNKLTKASQIFSQSDFVQAQRRIKDLKDEVKELDVVQKSLQINIDGFTQSIIEYGDEFEDLLEKSSGAGPKIIPEGEPEKVKRVKEDLTEINRLLDIAANERRGQFFEQAEGEIKIESGALSTGLNTESNQISENLDKLKQKSVDTTVEIANAFTGMSFQISEALGISDRNLRAFVGTLISNTPKIISAILAQAKASNAAANIANKGNLAQAKGNAIVAATASAKGLGPIGLALLPVLIGGALALISGAFGKSAGGGGGGSAPSAPAQSFGNAGIPQPTRQSLSDQNARATRIGSSGGRLEAVVTGDQIRFVLDQSGRRTGRG